MAVSAGQTLNDRLLAAKHSIAGQGLAKAICKASTEELIGPKKKHLDCKFLLNQIVNLPSRKQNKGVNWLVLPLGRSFQCLICHLSNSSRFIAMYRGTQCFHSNYGQPAYRTDPKPQLGRGIQIPSYSASRYVLWQRTVHPIFGFKQHKFPTKQFLG